MSLLSGFGLFTRELKPGKYVDDFPEGLTIVEMKDGRLLTNDMITLVGEFMPHDSLTFGGTQKIVKDYYAGNSDPVVQVLGSREDNTTIRGTLKAQRISLGSVDDTRKVVLEMQKLIDAMRIRGNLVRISLGEWRRYGFIEKVSFSMRTLTRIDYEIDFTITGFYAPNESKLSNNDSRDQLVEPNKDLTNKAVGLQKLVSTKPAEMPFTMFDTISEAISAVGKVTGSVTKFVDDSIADIQRLRLSANRAIGLIRNARAVVSRAKRSVSQLSHDVANLGSLFQKEWDQTSAAVKNIKTIEESKKQMVGISEVLKRLQKQFESIAKSLPMARHLVRQGETLQSISIKYYGAADNWVRIQDHNRLRSTVLAVGSVLEIPRA